MLLSPWCVTLSDANLPCTETKGHENVRHQELAKPHHLLQKRLLQHLVVKTTDSPIPHSTSIESFSMFENQYKVKRNFSSFFSHVSSWITSNFFRSNKEPHQILLRQSTLSSSTCCCIYRTHKPQKRPRELFIKNESHLHPSSLESLTSGKILSRIKRAQEVLYPRYPRRITSAWILNETIIRMIPD